MKTFQWGLIFDLLGRGHLVSMYIVFKCIFIWYATVEYICMHDRAAWFRRGWRLLKGFARYQWKSRDTTVRKCRPIYPMQAWRRYWVSHIPISLCVYPSHKYLFVRNGILFMLLRNKILWRAVSHAFDNTYISVKSFFALYIPIWILSLFVEK